MDNSHGLTIAPPRMRAFPVKDTIDRRRREDRPEPRGVILLLDDCRPINPLSLVDQWVFLRDEAGLDARVKVAVVRDHGATISLLIAGLNRSVIPIGSTILIDEDVLVGANSRETESNLPSPKS